MRVAGVMTGTSLDGADWVVWDDEAGVIVDSGHAGFPPFLKVLAQAVIGPGASNQSVLAELNHDLADWFADLLAQPAHDHKLAGVAVHGQTVLHLPQMVSIQAIQPYRLAHLLELPVIADFRNGDIARGGQGAPLVPAFHQQIFQSEENTVVLNLGGIGNISYLGADGTLRGFDVGPANLLLDAWIQHSQDLPFDEEGQWARQGTVNSNLLRVLRSESFFEQAPPKSTGREVFNLEWLTQTLKTLAEKIEPADVMATLVELSAWAVSKHLSYCPTGIDRLWVCGGGAYNLFLLERIEALCGLKPQPTSTRGIPVNLVEAAAFAWMGARRLNKEPLDLTQVTGATAPGLYGTIFRV